MNKLEMLSRAWIDCDPNRAGMPLGSGMHPDDIMPKRVSHVSDEGVFTTGVSDELAGQPLWKWFAPRAVALEQYFEERGWVLVRLEQTK